jgi:hypothetical protein
MSTPSNGSVCAACGQNLPSDAQDCPACHASAAWQDLLSAAQFAADRFYKWENDGLISRPQLAAITEADCRLREGLQLMAREGKPIPTGIGLPPIGRCWRCPAELNGSPSHCSACGAPVEGPQVQELRYWTYTCAAIKSHCEARRVPLSHTHACLNDGKGRIAAIRGTLEKQIQPVDAIILDEGAAEEPRSRWKMLLDPFAEEPASTAPRTATPTGRAEAPRPVEPRKPRPPRTPRRPLWEILLDPRSIQWLLALGGALLVLGLVIWLATLGIFKHPEVVAVALGLGNAVLLGGGWFITTRTRYETAGRALTLLSCLVMPLNLYFYHAHNLITLEGHLWAAALVCCLFYAASARVLRDRMFVYVLAGGVAMTGLLMLFHMGKFWDIAAPSTLLVALGLIFLHSERAFAVGDGPFSRQRFGLAFFWSGQALLAAGLLLLLGAQIAGDWLYQPFFKQFYEAMKHGPPAVVTDPAGRTLALILVVVAIYAYAYSDLIVRRVGVYIFLAVFALLWAEVLAIQLLPIPMTTEVVIIALAVTALAANLFAPSASRWQQSLAPGAVADSLELSLQPLQRAGMPLGLALSTLPVLLGVVLHLRATYVGWPLPDGSQYTVGWLYVFAMLITAVSCRIGAHLYRNTILWLSTTYLFGAAAATLVGVAGLLSICGMRTWDSLGPVLMVIPILYAIASRLYRGKALENPLAWVGQAATAVMLVALLAASAHVTPDMVFEPAVGTSLNLSLALISAEAAAFYLLMALFRKQGANVYLCTATACFSIWQLLLYRGVAPEYYTLTFALAGLVLLIGYRLAVFERAGLAQAAFESANALMSLSFVAAALLSLSRLAIRLEGIRTELPALDWSLVILLGALGLLSLVAAWLVRHAAWRRWYVVTAITEGALMFLAIHVLIHLSMWEKLELFAVVAGIGLLAAGHVGWYREEERQEDMVSFNLGCGAMLVGAPLTIAVLVHRGVPEFSTINELGMLVAGMLLLATGFMFQIRSTALTGAGLLTIYLVTLVLYINMIPHVQKAAIWMTIGGAVIFGTGILLSVYRDRLLMLPEQVKRREGIFRVLRWR